MPRVEMHDSHPSYMDTPRQRRYLILTASMGSGHTAVATELARRFDAAGHTTVVADILDLLPLRLGAALRRSYEAMLRLTPWLYDGIFWLFFLQHNGFAPSVSPMSVLAGFGVRRLVRTLQPDAVLSTFHMAGEVTGRLRARGDLTVPCAVVVTESSLHRLWLHSGNDFYLCPYPAIAAEASERTGRPSLSTGPLVHPEFRQPQDRAAVRAELGLAPGERAVLVSTGSWGVGDIEDLVRLLARSGRYVPVALCGRNDALRKRLTEVIGEAAAAVDRPGRGVALGWRDDMPAVMAAAAALVDNAGGLTCMEAFAAAVPVIGYRPIPGHGRHGVQALARLGLIAVAYDASALLSALDEVTADGPVRENRLRAAAALFAGAPEYPGRGVESPDDAVDDLVAAVERSVLSRTTDGAA